MTTAKADAVTAGKTVTTGKTVMTGTVTTG
jgi:hypothetical protein